MNFRKPACDLGIPQCSQCGQVADSLLNGRCEACEPKLREMKDREREREERRRDLVWQMRTRLLTPEEMLTVRNMGVWLVIGSEPYTPLEKEREFSDLLWQQFRFRVLVNSLERAS